MAALRVLVVEDSATVRHHLVEVLGEDPEIVVVGAARDGREGIELCQALRPDVLTVDMALPVMSGMSVVEYLMAYYPTPILVVSSSINRGEVYRTFEALAAGAVDVLEKPLGTEAEGEWERKLVAAVKLVARVKVITHPRAKLTGLSARPQQPSVNLPPGRRQWQPRLVALGASTGGPGAVRAVLRGLPADFPLPILVVIHISRLFANPLVEWLNADSPLPVAQAVQGERLPSRGSCRVILAPPERHLVVAGARLQLTSDPERHSCRPSVDVLFESVAREVGADAVGGLLTGMGRDGAAGLLAMRQAGAMTLAQDEATSVVFGMPREAILLGGAVRVLPLGEIAPTLVNLARGALSRGGRP